MATKQVVIIGGGLAGLCAAHTVLENGGSVVLLDKSAFMGGNSTKATSGMNGALTKTQIAQGITQDSPEVFEKDTLDSAAQLARPELIKVLTHESASGVEWLQSKFKLDLSLVSRLGGHSFPRTHRGKERFPGFTITYALMEALEAVQASGGPARILCKARATKLIKDAAGVVSGVEYVKDNQTKTEFGSVVIATGGYAADYTSDSLLMRHRPDLAKFPTTNGDHCTGDGIKMAETIGAGLVDMEYVQVHPTGLVFPNEPDAKVIFLAAEALRGVGGLMLDATGNRFVDELGRRDFVSGEMFKNKAPFYLVLGDKASKEIEWHCKHYVGRGVMQRFDSGAELAKGIGVDAAVIQKTLNQYNEAARTGKDVYGKKYFQNTPVEFGSYFYVATITPVVHYCMGGLAANEKAQVLSSNGAVVPRLYCAGEVMGGVHGKNRLGGNSLLDCVVYGRKAGKICMEEYPTSGQPLSSSSAAERLGTILSHLLGTHTLSLQLEGNRLTFTMDLQSSLPNPSAPVKGATPKDEPAQPAYVPLPLPPPPPAASATSTPPASAGLAKPAAPSASGARTITKQEVAKHNKETDCWVIVNGMVLDVTSFLPDHPGGKKSILVFAGKDASEEFNMLHNPNVIEKYLSPECILGTVVE